VSTGTGVYSQNPHHAQLAIHTSPLRAPAPHATEESAKVTPIYESTGLDNDIQTVKRCLAS